MKILSLPLSSIKFNQNKKLNSTKAQTVPIANNSAQNNMAEIMGRAQVNFAGRAINSGSFFQYNNDYVLNSASEDITFDKVTGELIYKEYDALGNLSKEIKISPKDNIETIKEYDKEGVATVTNRYRDNYTVEQFSPQGERFYFEEGDYEGNKITFLTQEDRNREVIEKYEYNLKKETKVRDLTTNLFVDFGEIVEDRIFEDGRYITKNIVRGDIYKIEKYSPFKKLQYCVEYSKETGIKTREFVLDAETGISQESFYYENGNLEKKIETSKTQKEVTIKEYNEDGATLNSLSRLEFGRKGKLETKTIYNPATGYKEEKYSYINSQNYSKTTYREQSNVRHKKYVVEDGFLAKEITYAKDGVSYKKVRHNKRNGYFSDEIYRDAKKEAVAFYAPFDKENPYKIEVYIPGTDVMVKKLNVISQRGDYEATTYNPETGKIEKIEECDKNDNPIKTTEFFDDGITKKFIKIFNSDLSYRKITYNRNGKVIADERYNADDSKKTFVFFDDIFFDEDYKNENFASDIFADEEINKEFKKSSINKETIQQINEEMRNGFENLTTKIDEEHWKEFAKFVGLEDVNQLENMDRATYRILSKKLHPDQIENSGIEYKEVCSAELLFQIINALRERTVEKYEKQSI